MNFDNESSQKDNFSESNSSSEKINPQDIKSSERKCYICDVKFYGATNLKRHFKRNHPVEAEQFVMNVAKFKRKLRFQCDKCNRQFSNIRSINYHKTTVHQETAIQRIRCTICNKYIIEDQINESARFEHYKQEHNIDLALEFLKFNNFEEFMEWKKDVEKTSGSKYIHKRSLKQVNDQHKCYYFYCQRSAMQISKTRGIRRLKSGGSIKMKGMCPAEIKVIQLKDDRCSVTFTKTHVGHEPDMPPKFADSCCEQHLPSPQVSNLTVEERKAILMKEFLEILDLVTERYQLEIIDAWLDNLTKTITKVKP